MKYTKRQLLELKETYYEALSWIILTLKEMPDDEDEIEAEERWLLGDMD